MKKKLLNSMRVLLVAAGLVAGTNAWAEDAYTAIYQRNVTYGDTNIWTSADLTDWGGNTNLTLDIPTEESDAAVHYGLGHYTKPTGFTSTKTFTIKENSKIKYELNWYFGGAPGMNKAGTSLNYNFIQFGDKVRLSWRQGTYKLYLSTDGASGTDETTPIFSGSNSNFHKTITIIFDTSTKTVESFIFDGTDHTSKLAGTLAGDFNKISLGFVRNTTPSFNSPNRITTLAVSECEQAVTNADYTINYQLSGTTVKTVTGTSIVGAEITAETAIDGTEEGYVGKHYLATATVAPSMVLGADDASNVLNVPVRAPYTATVNVTTTLDGVAQTPVATVFTETDAKVCNWNYFWSKYTEKDGKFYIANDVSKFGEAGTFTDGLIINKTVAYTLAPTVAAYLEAESASTNSSNNTNYSGGKTGFVTGNNSYSLGTLPAGTYNLAVYLQDRGDRGIYLRNGSTTGTEIINLGTDKNSAAGVYDSNFTITENTALYLTGYTTDKGVNQSANIDYILITAISSSATLGTNGYATFASPYALDLANLPSGLTAYKASVSGTTVTFTQVTEAVAANTGLLLQGDASETYSIPVAASGTDISASNAFLVNSDGTTFTGNDDYYYFGLKANTLTFGLFNPASVAIPANKAYLKVLKTEVDGKGARTLNVVFGDESTGINTIETTSQQNGQTYNLSGQRVSKAQKGLYIVNGKKVIIK